MWVRQAGVMAKRTLPQGAQGSRTASWSDLGTTNGLAAQAKCTSECFNSSSMHLLVYMPCTVLLLTAYCVPCTVVKTAYFVACTVLNFECILRVANQATDNQEPLSRQQQCHCKEGLPSSSVRHCSFQQQHALHSMHQLCVEADAPMPTRQCGSNL